MRTLRNSPIVWAVIVAPVALVLGYAGYRSLPGLTMSRSDALFSSMQLFALEGSLPPQGTPWPLNAARFMAPLALAYATVVTVMSILRQQVERALVATFARGHVVLIGLGHTNALLAASMRRSGRQVVVVESDAANERLTAVRGHGVRVIIGDARQSMILQRAQTPRARHVIIATGDDSRNLEVAEQVRRITSHEGNGRRTTLHVSVDDQTLWAELGRLQLARVDTGVVLEFYNVIDRAAQTLLNEAERLGGLDVLRSAVVEGDGTLAQRTLVHLVRRAALCGIRPRVLLSEPTAEQVLAPLLEREPWMARAAELVIDGPDSAEVQSVPVALVCLSGPDANAIAKALILIKPPTRRAVYVSVHGQHSDALLNSAGAPENVHLVATSLKALGQTFLQHSGLELMARVRHEDYLRQERSRGVTASENPSLVVWEELPESLKESNRRFAESVGEVIFSLGGSLVPLQHLEPVQPVLDKGAVLERLAMNEHDRWMATLVSDGWTHSTGSKNPHRKTHPLLVPWSELPEAEKEKDRDAIRAVPRMLARVGFAIELPQAAVAAAEETGA